MAIWSMSAPGLHGIFANKPASRLCPGVRRAMIRSPFRLHIIETALQARNLRGDDFHCSHSIENLPDKQEPALLNKKEAGRFCAYLTGSRNILRISMQ